VIYAALVPAQALRATGATPAEAMPLLGSITLPYLALLLVVPALLNWIPDHPTGPLEDLRLSAVRCTAPLALLAPLAWHAWRTLEASPLADR